MSVKVLFRNPASGTKANFQMETVPETGIGFLGVLAELLTKEGHNVDFSRLLVNVSLLFGDTETGVRTSFDIDNTTRYQKVFTTEKDGQSLSRIRVAASPATKEMGINANLDDIRQEIKSLHLDLEYEDITYGDIKLRLEEISNMFSDVKSADQPEVSQYDRLMNLSFEELQSKADEKDIEIDTDMTKSQIVSLLIA